MSFWTENRERRIGIFMLLMSMIFSNNWNECKFNGNDMVLLSKQIFLLWQMCAETDEITIF